jgi:hypothetical protein
MKMKVLSKMLLMLLVAVMGLGVQSCTKEETTIVTTRVTYQRGDCSNVYYKGKNLMTIYNQASTNPQAVTDEEATALSVMNSALSAGDRALDSYDVLSDSQVMDIYKTAMKLLVSGEGYSGYLPIYRFDDGKEENKKEIGRITFTE